MRLPLATGNGAASFWAWTVGLVALAIVAPFFLYPVFLMNALCMALFACAFNLLIGYVGLLSFGHAAFIGMGSYLAAYSAKMWGLSPELAILTGVAVAAVLGLVFGYLAIRRQGIYFAMITLAFAQMVYFFCVQAPFTGGEDGLQAVPRGHLFGLIDLARPADDVLFRPGGVSDRFRSDRAHDPFAVRPGAEGDPRERAARDLARL